MTRDWTTLLTLARLGVVALGVATTVISFKAYHTERSRYLRDATMGFALITIGVIIEGVLFQLTSLSLSQVHVVESVAISLGFLVLLRSLLW